MKVRLNEDRQVVDAIREGLKRTGGYCPCRLARTEYHHLHQLLRFHLKTLEMVSQIHLQ